MKISENRRLRGEKKALARHAHQERQNSRHEKKFMEAAEAIASGDSSKFDITKLPLLLQQAGRTQEELQAEVDRIRKELKDASDS